VGARAVIRLYGVWTDELDIAHLRVYPLRTGE